MFQANHCECVLKLCSISTDFNGIFLYFDMLSIQIEGVAKLPIPNFSDLAEHTLVHGPEGVIVHPPTHTECYASFET